MATQVATLSELRAPAQQAQPPAVRMSFFDAAGFDLMQRVAKAFAASTLVPKEYVGSLANCVIALNMAQRIGADPLMVMQNLYVVHGRPGWSAQFLIACFNQCGRFSALRYEWFGEKGKDTWGCRAYATEVSTGEKIIGPDITMALAKAEGWSEKSGSKWKTIPQLMLTYRAAAWLVRTHAPEIAMGLHTVEELHDVVDVDGERVTTEELRRGAGQTIDAGADEFDKGKPPETVDKETGEIATDLAGGFTYAQIADAINKADTAERCDELADIVRTWKDPKQAAELDVELRAKRKLVAA